jgi:hypothetical protein
VRTALSSFLKDYRSFMGIAAAGMAGTAAGLACIMGGSVKLSRESRKREPI